MGCGRRERGSTRPAPERRDRPRGQWGLSRGECRLVHTHPLCSTVEPQGPGLEPKSPAVPILTRADPARAPPAALPGASSRNPRVRGQAGQRPGRCGQVRAGGRLEARPRLAAVPSARNSAPRRPFAYLVPPPPGLRASPRHAAPRPGRSAGSTGLGATASPWRRGGGKAEVARARRRRSPAPEVPPDAGTREGTSATPTGTPDPSSSSFGTGSGPACGDS